MALPPRYCSNCGAPLNQEARFCGQCGRPVQASAAPPQPPAQAPTAPAEPVVGVIPFATQRKGLFKSATYNLVITAQRIIFATVTDQMQKDQAQMAVEQAKEQGKGFLGRTAAVWGSRNALWQRYLTMPVEQIIAEHPENTFVLTNQIKSARVRFGDSDDNTPDTLNIETMAGKMNLELRYASADNARQLLKQVLGSRVR